MPSKVILALLKLITGWVTLIMPNTTKKKHSKHMGLLENTIREVRGHGMGSEMFIYARKITRVPSTPSNKLQRLILIMHGAHGHGTNKETSNGDSIIHRKLSMYMKGQLLQAIRQLILLSFIVKRLLSMR